MGRPIADWGLTCCFEQTPTEFFKDKTVNLRRRAGLTQTQVADRLGRPQSQSRARLHRVTVVELPELAEAIGFEPTAALRRVAKVAKR